MVNLYLLQKIEQLRVPTHGVPGQSLVLATIDVRKHVKDSVCHVIERGVLGRVSTESKDRRRRVRSRVLW